MLPIVASLVVLTGCGTTAGHSAARTSATSVGSLRGLVFSTAAGRARTEAALSLLHLPPGAVRLSAAPAQALSAPVSSIPVWTVVDDARWWLVPGSAARLATYESAHPPAGFTISAGGVGYLKLIDLGVTPIVGRNTPELNMFDLQLLQIGDHVGVRADAQIIVQQARTVAETIPASVTSALLTYDLEPVGATSYRKRVLDAAQVQALARTLNPLPTDPYNGGCPMISEGLITLTMTYADHQVIISSGPEWCFDVNVMFGAAQQPLLHGSDAFAALARRLLGLPPTA